MKPYHQGPCTEFPEGPSRHIVFRSHLFSVKEKRARFVVTLLIKTFTDL